ncbi:hypothetical protein JCM9279_002689 [Rhodotorula babjevae]
MLLRLLAPCRRAANHGPRGRSLIAAASSNRFCSSATTAAVELARLSDPDTPIHEPARQIGAPGVAVERVEDFKPAASASSSSAASAVSPTTAPVEDVDETAKVDKWAWRRARGEGYISRAKLCQYLYKLNLACNKVNLDFYRPSTWLPRGASPIKMHKRCEEGEPASAAWIAKVSAFVGVRFSPSADANLVLVDHDELAHFFPRGARLDSIDHNAPEVPARNYPRFSAPVVQPGTDLSGTRSSVAAASAAVRPAALSLSSTPPPLSPSTPPAGLPSAPLVPGDTRPDDFSDELADAFDDGCSTGADKPSPRRARLVFAADAQMGYRELVSKASQVAARHFDLETMRLLYAHAKRHGGAAFLSIDVEGRLARRVPRVTELGWTSLEFVVDPKTGEVEERRVSQHAVVRENMREDDFPLDDDELDFAFGRTLVLPQRAIYHTLAALLHALSYQQHVFLLFHDPRSDLRALDQLGFDTSRSFRTRLRELNTAREDEGAAWVVDTQRLFSAWAGRAPRIGLEKACAELKVPTASELFHNAGNDARYTLNLFERLMDRSLRPDPTSPLVLGLTDRLIAAGLEGLQETLPVGEVDEQEDEEEGEAEEDPDDDDVDEEDEATSAPS